MAPARRLGPLVSERDRVSASIHGDAGQTLTSMKEMLSDAAGDDLRTLIHRLNNQLGVILAHAELLEAKAPDRWPAGPRHPGRIGRAPGDEPRPRDPFDHVRFEITHLPMRGGPSVPHVPPPAAGTTLPPDYHFEIA